MNNIFEPIDQAQKSLLENPAGWRKDAADMPPYPATT